MYRQIFSDNIYLETHFYLRDRKLALHRKYQLLNHVSPWKGQKVDQTRVMDRCDKQENERKANLKNTREMNLA